MIAEKFVNKTSNVAYNDILLYILNILKGDIMKKVFLLAGILMLLSACAEDKSNDTGTNSYQVTGNVIYTADNFKSAKVCVDANNNGLADDTYCTESAVDGSYSFTSSDSISSYPLAASITTANTAVNARLNNGEILMYAPKGKAGAKQRKNL